MEISEKKKTFFGMSVEDLLSGMVWVNGFIGAAGIISGIRTFIRLPSTAVIPLRFSLSGAVLWSVSNRYSFVIYPITSAILIASPFCVLWDKKDRLISYPFQFQPEERQLQRNVSLGYITGTSLATNLFFLTLTTSYLPRIILEQSSSTIPARTVQGFVGVVSLLTFSYFGTLWKYSSSKQNVISD
mmetsp:Transcript_18065/g.25083  ORF Transcript_18065/g.25083 Transcript_18065/m.25083 type:complete len:186 (-) Transcript_18065:215-772(-)